MEWIDIALIAAKYYAIGLLLVFTSSGKPKTVKDWSPVAVVAAAWLPIAIWALAGHAWDKWRGK